MRHLSDWPATLPATAGMRTREVQSALLARFGVFTVERSVG